MTEQERLEEILRGIHVLFAEAEPVLDDDDLIVVDQKSLYQALEALNRCVADIMERYEVTIQSREAAENRTRRDLEKMVAKAQQTADDIYAASLLYMDGTLQEMEKRMQRMQKDVLSVTGAFADDITARIGSVNANREELREQMHTLMEDEEYLNLVRGGTKLWNAAEEDFEAPDEEDFEGPDEEDLEGPDDEELEGYDPMPAQPTVVQVPGLDAQIQIHTDAAYFKAKEAAAADSEE